MTSGRPLPILALHSGGTTPALWRPVASLLPDLQIETPDLNRICAELPWEACFLDLVEALAARMPEGPMVLAGTGLGGKLALALAARLGDRVRHLYLIVPGPAQEDLAFRQTVTGLRRFLIDGFRPEAVATLVPAMLFRYGPRFREASAELEAILLEGCGKGGEALGRVIADLGPLNQELLPRIAAGIEVIFGASNPILEEKWVASWRHVPQVRSVEVLPNLAHEVALENPGRVAADLRRLATAA